MTAQILQVINTDQTLEIFINDKNMVYIGEVSAGGEYPFANCITISYEDWLDVKKFIDRQFKEIL
jgi:hypothetical protein